jgi:hypothetical protein
VHYHVSFLDHPLDCLPLFPTTRSQSSPGEKVSGCPKTTIEKSGNSLNIVSTVGETVSKRF